MGHRSSFRLGAARSTPQRRPDAGRLDSMQRQRLAWIAIAAACGLSVYGILQLWRKRQRRSSFPALPLHTAAQPTTDAERHGYAAERLRQAHIDGIFDSIDMASNPVEVLASLRTPSSLAVLVRALRTAVAQSGVCESFLNRDGPARAGQALTTE